MSLENIIGVSIPEGDRILTYGNPQRLSVVGIIRDYYTKYIYSNPIPIQAIFFSSSNEEVVSVDSNGVISAVFGRSGENIIISATTYGITSGIKVTVPSEIGTGYAMGILGGIYAD